MEQKTEVEKKARDLIAQGYYQVSGKYRMLSKLADNGLPEEAHIEVDRETFEAFRRLGGVTWSEGAHRLTQHKQRATLLDLLRDASVDLKTALFDGMTVRDLYIRLGGLAEPAQGSADGCHDS